MKKRILSEKELDAQLKQFEAKYFMKSREFAAKFNRGELPENTDFLQWITYYDMAGKAGLINEHLAM